MAINHCEVTRNQKSACSRSDGSHSSIIAGNATVMTHPLRPLAKALTATTGADRRTHAAAASNSAASSRNEATAALEVRDQGVAELTALHFGGTRHHAGEIVGHNFLTDGFIHGINDGIGGFGPAHIAQHHFTRENH